MGPKAKTNTISANASHRLISERFRMPLSIPSITDATAIAVMPRIRVICKGVVFEMPNRVSRPAPTCWAPRPSDVARPNRVPNTARTSTTKPGQRLMRSPSSGYSAEAGRSGRPLRNAK